MTTVLVKNTAAVGPASLSAEDGLWSDLAVSVSKRFSGLDPEVVLAAVDAARDQFAGARVRQYLQILAEREVRALLADAGGPARAVR